MSSLQLLSRQGPQMLRQIKPHIPTRTFTNQPSLLQTRAWNPSRFSMKPSLTRQQAKLQAPRRTFTDCPQSQPACGQCSHAQQARRAPQKVVAPAEASKQSSSNNATLGEVLVLWGFIFVLLGGVWVANEGIDPVVNAFHTFIGKVSGSQRRHRELMDKFTELERRVRKACETSEEEKKAS
ncbi:hypothetical protein PV11_04816 [Exophiala sideris]|uniref:Uncharacterized protein n=1 Tax=Exophiala sideris TaxID=1016849 RepID=A0A0D1W1U0_9EURO|nr:hypothetical protein PV11_04816 [Exophiala sideris]